MSRTSHRASHLSQKNGPKVSHLSRMVCDGLKEGFDQ